MASFQICDVDQIPLASLNPQMEFYCLECRNDFDTLCIYCGCFQCGRRDTNKLLVCDKCKMFYHHQCLPNMTDIHLANWRCDRCKETNKENQIIAATVGKDHVGKIPGIPVGTIWRTRMEAAASGIHRPTMAGIHGTESVGGAISIVLAGGYEGDVDNGEEFIYTGSGGRDAKGVVVANQELTRQNLAMAMACAAPLNKTEGAEASQWHVGRPIRVVRSAKLKKKDSRFAPDSGHRYDGIYKVVKYWREKGPSNFFVWRFLMRRDDDEPPPWTQNG